MTDDIGIPMRGLVIGLPLASFLWLVLLALVIWVFA